MKYILCIIHFLLVPSIGTRIGCLKNATFSGIPSVTWLNNTINCQTCTCYMLTKNFSAVNCYNNVSNYTSCLMFSNYLNATNGVQLITGKNSSLACFTQFPPELKNLTSLYYIFSFLTFQQLWINIYLFFFYFSCFDHHRNSNYNNW